MRRDRLPGLALALLGVAAGLEATTFDVTFLTDPVGPKALPGLAALTLVIAGAHAALRPPSATVWPPRPVLARLGAALGAFLAYGLVLPWIGFFASTTLVVATLSRLFGAPWRRGALAAAALSAALWLLFVQALALPLPIGDLWTR